MRLVWGQLDQRRYETGVDRGVLYPTTGPGVAWNGIVNVEESFDGGDLNSYHFDGIKYVDIVGLKTYQADLTAFSAPEEFSYCLGEKSVLPGLILTRQPRGRFGLSYRTMLDTRGYKIHLVYNASASPSGRTYSTLSEAVDATTLSWKINAVPIRSSTHRPAAHYIFDSTKMDPAALDILETMLYGTDDYIPRMPNFEELTDLLADFAPLLIMTEPLTGLSELVPGSGDLYKTTVAGIHRTPPGTRLYPSLISGLYRME
jgi:hypothetical protein